MAGDEDDPHLAALQRGFGEGMLFGLPALDAPLQGVVPGQLFLVAGPPSGGKTQLSMHLLLQNRKRRIIWITPDETHGFVIRKLLCIEHGLTMAEAKRWVETRDPRVRRFTQSLTGLVFGESGKRDDIQKLTDEAARRWGEPPELIGLDYVGRLRLGDYETPVSQKVDWLKETAIAFNTRILALHQSNRGGINPPRDPRGRMAPPTMADIREAGEAESFQIVWCRRGDGIGGRKANEVWVLKNKWNPESIDQCHTFFVERGGRYVGISGRRPE